MVLGTPATCVYIYIYIYVYVYGFSCCCCVAVVVAPLLSVMFCSLFQVYQRCVFVRHSHTNPDVGNMPTLTLISIAQQFLHVSELGQFCV